MPNSFIAADPLSIVDPAFILTVGATLGILILMPVTPVHRLPRRLAPLATMLAASPI